MANPAKSYYWDACIWISLIMQEHGRYDRVYALIEEARRGDSYIWTSTLTYAEVFKKRCGAENVSLPGGNDSDFEAYVQQDFLKLAAVHQDIGILARALLRKFEVEGLKKPVDALHLATAVFYNLDEMHTFDNADLLRLDGKVYRRDSVLLKICEPPRPIMSDIFAGQSE